MKNITKTSKQAQLEKLLNKENTDNICPECKYPNIGSIVTRGSFFKTEKMKKYTCFKCDCEWNTGWKTL